MTQSKRIIVNILATYGRTLLGVVCGIFSVRWVLMALGEEGYGLFGVVGSLASFITFFNTQFSGALSRYYAFAIGEASVAKDIVAGIEECRRWFSTGVAIHVVLPLILVGIGFPLGEYAIGHNWLTIPSSRVDDCIWLWRFVCISCFVAMLNVPFQAMYQAKQYIAELTVYSLAQTLFRTGFIYYMTTVERDWLLGYGMMMCVVAVVPQALICLRAYQVFPECRFRIRALREVSRVVKIAKYAWWQTFVGIGYMARHQFLEIVVNKWFGPKVNSAYTVGATVGVEAATLTGALNGAFCPAITTACGAGDYETMRAMAYRASKYGTLLTLIFALPMFFEIDELLLLWLKEPPRFATGLCLYWLVVVVIEKFSLGHVAAVFATGNVAKFSLFRGLACLTAIPLSLLSVWLWRSVYAVSLSLIVTTVIFVIVDIILARGRTGMSYRYFVFKIILPILFVTTVSAGFALLPIHYMEQSFCRLIVTTLVVEIVLLPLSWFVVLDDSERAYVTSKIMARLGVGGKK